MLSDQQFIHYLRQLSLPEVGEQGQSDLLNKKILIVGCGGLGTAAALYLAGSGIGEIVIADGDKVERSNLARQLTYSTTDVGRLKVDALADRLNAVNPEVKITKVSTYLQGEQLSCMVRCANIVLDCSDNLSTRHEINRACVHNATDLISGSAIGWSGQLITFDFSQPKRIGCYRCLFPFDELPNAQRCSNSGVMGPVVGMIGVNQALEAIKLALGMRTSDQSIKLFDGLNNRWQSMSLCRDELCSVCSKTNME